MERTRVEQGIAFLLHTHDCVILPGFGGIIANYVPAKMDYSRGLMFPPSKELSFNSALTRDDGLLADYLSVREKISHGDAKRDVNLYVTLIRKKLQKGHTFFLQGVGEFKFGKQDKIIFQPSREENFLANSYGLYPVSIITEARRQNIKVRPSKKHLRKAVMAIPLAAVLATVSWIGFTDNQFKNQLAGLLHIDKNEKVEYRERYPFQSVQEDESGGGLLPSHTDQDALFLDLSEESDAFLWPVKNTTVAVPAVKTPAKSSSAEISPKAEVKKAPAPEAVAPEASKGKPFHVITGCFSVKENAEKHIEQMKSAGLDLFIAGFEKGLFRVSAGGFSSRQEAAGKRAELQKSASPSAWIWKTS